MSIENISQLIPKIFELVKDLDAQNRMKVFKAVNVLFAEATPADEEGDEEAETKKEAAATKSAEQFFHAKQPKNKGEELAVASRFLEIAKKKREVSREEIEATITGARRDFDDTHFARDIKNATRQAGLFNRSATKGQYQLSAYGIQYVDALPNRDEVKQIPKLRRKRKSKTAAKPAKRKSE